jgi:hypothetical protein
MKQGALSWLSLVLKRDDHDVLPGTTEYHPAVTPISEREAYDELCAYTLTHGGAAFIHQHVVDAFAVQHATKETKPIAVTFGLAGLYLHVEKQLTGRQVQLAHMKMAKQKRTWPQFVLPAERGDMRSIDVLAKPEGPDRDAAIHAWSESVWRAFVVNRSAVIALLKEYNIK